MALVLFMKGINVGGHRTFRPTRLARQLRHLDVVSVGAAGTFVVRGRVRRADLRAEVSSRLPFEVEMMICSGDDVIELRSDDPFAGQPTSRDIVRFVSVMAKRPRRPSALPAAIPAVGRWGVRVLGRRGQFIFGLYRREMKAIGYLGQLETLVGAPLATRSWSTLMSVATLLET